LGEIRWEIKAFLAAYLLANIYTKNYCSPSITVKMIIGGWVAYFFETHCISL